MYYQEIRPAEAPKASTKSATEKATPLGETQSLSHSHPCRLVQNVFASSSVEWAVGGSRISIIGLAEAKLNSESTSISAHGPQCKPFFSSGYPLLACPRKYWLPSPSRLRHPRAVAAWADFSLLSRIQ